MHEIEICEEEMSETEREYLRKKLIKALSEFLLPLEFEIFAKYFGLEHERVKIEKIAYDLQLSVRETRMILVCATKKVGSKEFSKKFLEVSL